MLGNGRPIATRPIAANGILVMADIEVTGDGIMPPFSMLGINEQFPPGAIVEDAQFFTAGATEAQSFVAGAEDAQTFVAGAEEAQSKS